MLVAPEPASQIIQGIARDGLIGGTGSENGSAACSIESEMNRR
jgi:hypothetical protein